MIELGKCEKPHGIKGGFSFYLYNTEDSSLEVGTEVILFPKNSSSALSQDGEKFIIKKIAFGNKVICYLEDVLDRNRVEELIPFEIKITENQLGELLEDEFYLRDFLKCDVYDYATKKKR